jgi:hypothetical protein
MLERSKCSEALERGKTGSLPICTICLWITCGKLLPAMPWEEVPETGLRLLERHTEPFHNDLDNDAQKVDRARGMPYISRARTFETVKIRVYNRSVTSR